MTADITTYLKYANLQMAAEALFQFHSQQPNATLVPGATASYSSINPGYLTTGNNRASKFTETQAAEFVQVWEVVEHKSNTSTGFSGTLFKARDGAPPELLAKYGVKAGELVMSFRSTEFADDAVRDTQATNSMEIQEKGWAFGQIADMESWFAELNKPGGPLAGGKSFAVTGYSLGGHLATAFNLLRKEDGSVNRITATYTFNGAGVGNKDNLQSLKNLIADFGRRRENLSGHENDFSNVDAQWVYGQIRKEISIWK